MEKIKEITPFLLENALSTNVLAERPRDNAIVICGKEFNIEAIGSIATYCYTTGTPPFDGQVNDD